MTSIARLSLLLTLSAALLYPPSAAAQERGPLKAAADLSPAWAGGEIPPLFGFQPRSNRKALLVGVAIGAGTALALTAAAASRYGENEGGSFCSRCMLQWSAVSVPIGAAVGAGIGYGVSRSRRSITASPVFSRRVAAVVVSARF